MVSLGFIGTGAITDAVVQGLHAAGNMKHDIPCPPGPRPAPVRLRRGTIV
jgi:pyrroline-5-carboxylate reductase